MKKIYEQPEVEIQKFVMEDVITVSTDEDETPPSPITPPFSR